VRSFLWVPLQAVIVIHDRQIARHGGAPGIRDLGLLEGAIQRPRNKASDPATSLDELAAAYAFEIVTMHPFVDGNKRTAFAATAAFLRLNGYGFRPDPFEGVRAMEDLASGALGEGEFATWLSGLMTRLDR
jgi:death-on-curing protein